MPRERMYRPKPGTKAICRYPGLGNEPHVVTVLHQGRDHVGIYTRVEFDFDTTLDPSEFMPQRVHDVHPSYIHPLDSIHD